jgi:hypothetical protein
MIQFEPKDKPSVRPRSGAKVAQLGVQTGLVSKPAVVEEGPVIGNASATPPATGRPRIEDAGQTIEARKPWVALKMSRATFYRRRAETKARHAARFVACTAALLRRFDG